METVTKVLYEAMFLVDSAEAASDWEGINQVITGILEKFGAEIISSRKWDEAKLAYDVNKKSRGTYILCYFRCEGVKIQDIERSVQLSERIMRVLILNAEHMTEEDLAKDTPAGLTAKRVEEQAAAKAEAEAKAAVEAEEAAAKAAEEAEVSVEAEKDVDGEEAVVVDAIESDAPEIAVEPEEDVKAEPEVEQQEESGQ